MREPLHRLTPVVVSGGSDSGSGSSGSTTDPGHVRFNHDANQILEPSTGHPAEHSFGLGEVAAKVVNFGRPIEPRVYVDASLPIGDSRDPKRFLYEFSNGMGLPGRPDEFVRFVIL